jgi:hypothetical protein
MVVSLGYTKYECISNGWQDQPGGKINREARSTIVVGRQAKLPDEQITELF